MQDLFELKKKSKQRIIFDILKQLDVRLWRSEDKRIISSNNVHIPTVVL